MAAAAIVPPQDPQQPAPLSEAQRLIDTFIAPAKTFTDLRRSAMWWAPFLLIVIVSVLFVSVVDQKIGFRKVFDNIIQQQPKQAERIENLPSPKAFPTPLPSSDSSCMQFSRASSLRLSNSRLMRMSHSVQCTP
jgi:hypothetical protein